MIKIFKDRWVSGFNLLNLSSNPEMENGWNDIVDMLLDAHFKWDEQKILSMFNPRVAINILKIKLGTTLRPDTIIWLGERIGSFSVKSTY